VGDAVMSLPALRALRERLPQAHIAILAKPWVAECIAASRFATVDPVYRGDLTSKWRAARELRPENFDCAILFQNAFEAAAIAFAARIPERIGYARDGRSPLLTKAIAVPRAGEIPRHQRFYYLELLRRAGLSTNSRRADSIRLEGAPEARLNGIARFRELGLGDCVVA